MGTHTAAGGDIDLHGVDAGSADALQVERLVRRRLVVTSVDHQRYGVDHDADARRPVGVHVPVLVVKALELHLQVRSVVCVHAEKPAVWV